MVKAIPDGAFASDLFESEEYDPLQTLRGYLEENGFSFQAQENQIITWTQTDPERAVCFRWEEEKNLFSFACAFQYSPEEKVLPHLEKLLIICSESLPVGHFEYSAEEEAIYYRDGLFLVGCDITDTQIKLFLSMGASFCDTYMAAFAAVLAGMPAPQALEHAKLLDNVQGRA